MNLASWAGSRGRFLPFDDSGIVSGSGPNKDTILIQNANGVWFPSREGNRAFQQVFCVRDGCCGASRPCYGTIEDRPNTAFRRHSQPFIGKHLDVLLGALCEAYQGRAEENVNSLKFQKYPLPILQLAATLRGSIGAQGRPRAVRRFSPLGPLGIVSFLLAEKLNHLVKERDCLAKMPHIRFCGRAIGRNWKGALTSSKGLVLANAVNGA